MSRTFFIDIDGTIVKHLSNAELDKIIYEISTNKKKENSFKEVQTTKLLLRLQEQSLIGNSLREYL